ncbi:DMT family transporter [Desulfuromonas acetoxidans]|uniref:DMT family transporter n=1 Tax=Desulfuromonas acetoxidans TaxID=891 RepID=UPI002931833D|nr:DMT family transporter [Desulfuromonas acetoxidans]
MKGPSDGRGQRGGCVGKEGTERISANSYSLGLWLAVISAFGFSFKAILIKLAYALPQQVPVDAVTLLTLRMLFALPFFLLLLRSSGHQGRNLNRKDLAVVIILGAVGYYGASLFDFLGLKYVSAGLERVVLFSFPLLTLFFDAIFSGRKIRSYEWLAVVICYCGIGLAFVHDMDVSGVQEEVWVGGGLVFLSALCYAFYLSGGRHLIARYGSSRFACLALVVSTAATLLHFAVSHPLSNLVQPWQIYLLAFIMGTFSTVMPVLTLAAAVRRIGSSPAALISSLGPVLTIFFSWLILDEAVSLLQMGGTLLVIGGIWLVGKKGRQAAD